MSSIAFPKPASRKSVKRKAASAYADNVAKIRAYVCGRELGLCRCCRFRLAESMHEIRPRSLGGKVSRRNSIAVCGSGTSGCHGFLQAHGISCYPVDSDTAEGVLFFTPVTDQAREWIRLGRRTHIESAPMAAYEAAE